MRREAIAATLIVLLGFSSGCFRMRYVNLVDPERVGPPELIERDPTSSWRSFWLFGWSPDLMVIDAAAACGSVENIAAIETRMTFAQAVINAVAGYYINIYAPYTGAVICKNGQPRTHR